MGAIPILDRRPGTDAEHSTMARPDHFKHLRVHPEIADTRFAIFAANQWTLEVRCWSCKKPETYWDGAELVRRFGPGGTTRQLDKLKCECGATRPAMTALVIPGQGVQRFPPA
jgi:hypothetical protein